ncbi:MAG: response regulator [Planctomycetota bacterium]
MSRESGGSSERSVFLVVADDRPAVLRNLPERLDPARYEVDVQPFGEEALRTVRERAPRVVLLDAERLYTEGHAPVEQVRAASPRTRVLFLDEDSGWLLFIEPSGEEAADLLVHPCPAEELSTALEAILNAPPPGSVSPAT